MTLQLLDYEKRKLIKVESYFLSLIWTERFQEIGDVELHLELTKENVEAYIEDRYLLISESNTLMIIDYVLIDSENDEITVKGHSFDIVLDRRIWHEWNPEKTKLPSHTLKDCFETVIEKTFHNENNYSGMAEYIKKNTDLFPETSLIKASMYYYPQRGDNIGEYVRSLAKAYGYGIRTDFNKISKDIVFKAYIGNETNVVLGKGNFNFKDSKYVKSTENFLTTVMIGGEGEGTSRQILTLAKSITVKDENSQDIEHVYYTGVKQREIFVDARDIQRGTGETKEQYKKRLKQRGTEVLLENEIEELVDGVISDQGPYRLNEHYFLGDIVTIKDEYYTAKARIDEVIRSWDEDGNYTAYPTVSILSILTENTIVSTNIN